MAKDKLVMNELLVVEGIHDKQAVERAVRADVWVLGGERVSRQTVVELQRARLSRGVIILTDPDGPGERIRRRIDSCVPGCKHAFVPKRLAATTHGVGVEHAAPDVICEALLATRTNHLETDNTDLRVGVVVDDSGYTDEGDMSEFTLADLIQAGLAHGPGAANRRQQIGEHLGIGYGNAKAFVRKLNVLGVKRTEWEVAMATLFGQPLEGE